MQTRHKIGLSACVVLTLVALYTCIRIEVFNAHANGYLPRSDPGEWREASTRAIRSSAETAIQNQAIIDGKPFVITATQEAQIAQDIRKWEENNTFRSFVSSFGLAQYIVASLAFWLAGTLSASKNINTRTRCVSISLAVLSGICMAMMFYRGYFSSLMD